MSRRFGFPPITSPFIASILVVTFGFDLAGAQGTTPSSRNATPSAPTPEVSAVLSANRTVFTLTRQHNVKTLTSAFDDSLIWINPDGSVQTKAQRLATLDTGFVIMAPSGPARRQFNTLTVDEELARCFGPSCVVTGRYYWDIAGYAAENRYLRVFVRRNGRWLLLVHHATRIGPPDASLWAPPTGMMESTFPSDTHAIEAEVLKTYRAWVDASLHRDTATLRGILADDYQFQNWAGGVSDKRQQLSLANNLRGRISLVSDEIQVRIAGELAVLSVRRSQPGSGYGTEPRPGLVRLTAVFVKRDGRWQAIVGEVAPVLTRAAPIDFTTS